MPPKQDTKVASESKPKRVIQQKVEVVPFEQQEQPIEQEYEEQNMSDELNAVDLDQDENTQEQKSDSIAKLDLVKIKEKDEKYLKQFSDLELFEVLYARSLTSTNPAVFHTSKSAIRQLNFEFNPASRKPRFNKKFNNNGNNNYSGKFDNNNNNNKYDNNQSFKNNNNGYKKNYDNNNNQSENYDHEDQHLETDARKKFGNREFDNTNRRFTNRPRGRSSFRND